MKIKYWQFIILWFVINIFQAATTELTSDEGYYWFYATKLSWGYYDHPPILAVLIAIGKAIFNSELGVRFMNILLISVSLFPFFKLIPESYREKNTTYLILLALPLLNYITFLAFPDSPLIAFFVWFLYGYKQLIEKNNWNSALIMTTALTLMLYSKYHAILVVPILMLSNTSLFRNKKWYSVLFFSFLLYLPHLNWQFENDFPSFKYHLQGRARSFKFDYIIQYITQQIAVIGPLIVFSFLYKTKNVFERGLKFIVVGIFSFFLVMSVRGFVHLHWTSLTLFPLVILIAAYFHNSGKLKLLHYVGIPVALLFLVFRLYLSFRIFPVNNLNVDYYHGRELWAEDIQKIAGNSPVIFENQLREAPLYSFYSKNEMGIAMYPWLGKKSQYEIWNYEDSIQGKDVLLIRDKKFDSGIPFKSRMGKEFFYKKITDFRSYQNIEFTDPKISLDKDKVHIQASCKKLKSLPENLESIRCYLLVKNKENKAFNIYLKTAYLSEQSEEQDTYKFSFKRNAIPTGLYEGFFYLNDGNFQSSNSSTFKLDIQ